MAGCTSSLPENAAQSAADAGNAGPPAERASLALQERFLAAAEGEAVSTGSLPRDHFDVDWVMAVKQGLIEPKASIDGQNEDDLQVDFDIIFNSRDKLLKDVRFSHAVHTYWLNCESCHTNIFIPVKGTVLISMQDIWDGKYCGRCHGKVAFPTHVLSGPHFRANCLRCHNYDKQG